MSIDPSAIQQATCDRYGAEPSVPTAEAMVGVGLIDGVPINGLRHPPESGGSGWFIWTGGEIDQADGSFFRPMHLEHVEFAHPAVVPYLALPPGWRFLIAPDHEDVWFDGNLLKI